MASASRFSGVAQQADETADLAVREGEVQAGVGIDFDRNYRESSRYGESFAATSSAGLIHPTRNERNPDAGSGSGDASPEQLARFRAGVSGAELRTEARHLTATDSE